MARPNPEVLNAPPCVYTTYSGTNTTTPSATYGFYSMRRTWTGSITPGFKTKKLKTLPINSHSVFLTYDTAQPWSSDRWQWLRALYPDRWELNFYRWYRDSQSWETYYGCPDFSHLTGLNAVALGRAATQAAGLKVNLAQAFAERKQTADLLVSTVTRVSRAAIALRRGRLGDLWVALGLRGSIPKGGSRYYANLLKEHPDARLRNHWLEYKYGWMPLLQDAHDAAELLAYHAVNDLYHQRTSGSSKGEETVTFTAGSGKSTYSRKTRVKYEFDYRLESSCRAILAQTGLSNPALLAWELVPYSFVVDWFLPVGNYLQALTAFDGFELTRGCLTEFTTGTNNWVVDINSTTYANAGWEKNQVIEKGSWQRRAVRLNRTALSTFPSAIPPSFRNPIGGNPLDRFYTAYALLKGAFRK